MKAISKEQIEHAIMHTDGDSVEQRILALYDNAPSVVGEAVGYMSTASLINLQNGNDVIVGKKNELRDIGVYTIPQPDRVAELEAKLKEYEADAKRWNSLMLIYANNPNVNNYHKASLHVPWLHVKEYTKESFNESFDQAMKG